jgi:transcriptional regulator with XRE-family HTH domain
MKSTNSKKSRLILAKNLRLIRLKMNISQEQLAEMADLHRTYVSSVERAERNISIDNMDKLAAALGVDLPTLLTPEEPQ